MEIFTSCQERLAPWTVIEKTGAWGGGGSSREAKELRKKGSVFGKQQKAENQYTVHASIYFWKIITQDFKIYAHNNFRTRNLACFLSKTTV